MSAGFPRIFAKEDSVQRKYSRSERGESKASNGEGQRKFVIVHGQDSARAVYFENSHSHLGRQKQGGRACKKSDDEQHTAKRFQYAGNVNEISREAVLHEKSEDGGHGLGDFRVTVRQKNDSEGEAQNEQSNGLERA